jgi:hypothetical protein
MKNFLGFEVEDNKQCIIFKCYYEHCDYCNKLVKKSDFHCDYCKKCHSNNNRYCKNCGICIENYNNHSKKQCNNSVNVLITKPINLVNIDRVDRIIIDDDSDEYDII